MIEQFFGNISSDKIRAYTEYWASIAPKNDDDILRRWLFAYTSIKTTWEANVRGYNAIKDFHEWIGNREILRQKLIDAKCGLHNMRTDYIWDFAQDFIANRSAFHRIDNETWAEFRNRLVERVRGIGMAKVSFTLEMCFPNEAEVVCLDTHMLQLYGLSNTIKFAEGKGKQVYSTHEKDWVDRSKQVMASACVSRAIYWDTNQNKEDSRYWSFVLEA